MSETDNLDLRVQEFINFLVNNAMLDGYGHAYSLPFATNSVAELLKIAAGQKPEQIIGIMDVITKIVRRDF